jgi:hypothetical protein
MIFDTYKSFLIIFDMIVEEESMVVEYISYESGYFF